MTQTHITHTTSLDAWTQSGGAVAGTIETVIGADESLQAAGPTPMRGFCYRSDVALNAAAHTRAGLCPYGTELQSAAVTAGFPSCGGWRR